MPTGWQSDDPRVVYISQLDVLYGFSIPQISVRFKRKVRQLNRLKPNFARKLLLGKAWRLEEVQLVQIECLARRFVIERSEVEVSTAFQSFVQGIIITRASERKRNRKTSYGIKRNNKVGQNKAKADSCNCKRRRRFARPAPAFTHRCETRDKAHVSHHIAAVLSRSSDRDYQF